MEQLYKKTFGHVTMSEKSTQVIRSELIERCAQCAEVRQEIKPVKRTKRIGKVTLAAAIAAILCCVGAGAIAVRGVIRMTPEQRSIFYEEIFGNDFRQNIDAQYHEGEHGRVTLNLPNTERVPVDQAEAAELIGPHLSDEVYVLTGEGYTLTVEGYVFDRTTLTGQLCYSLENPSGISGLSVGEGDNEVWNDGTGIGVRCSAFGHTYLDPERSTATKYYIVAPMVMGQQEESVDLELFCYREGISEIIHLDRVSIPLGTDMPRAQTEGKGEKAVMSPIGMCLEGAKDWGSLKYSALEYRDGSRYVLLDREKKQDNTAYRLISEGIGADPEEKVMRLVFNRLVDVEQVAAVWIDDARLPIK